MSPLPDFLFDIARNPVLAGALYKLSHLTNSGLAHWSRCHLGHHHWKDIQEQLVHGESFPKAIALT